VTDKGRSLDSLVLEARRREATLLVLIPGEPPTYRVNGRLVRSEGEVLGEDEVRAIAEDAIGPRLAQIGPSIGSASAPKRIGDIAAGITVSSAGGLPTVAVYIWDRLGFDAREMRIPPALLRALDATHGLIMITGPSGTGKTSTAYALLEQLNKTAPVHIVTVEDPVEVLLEPKQALIQQRQVGLDVPDFLAGIVAARRQDLDVLYMGEVRSIEVLNAAVAAAETGHLVLLPLHQPTPEAALRRIIELQPPETRDTFRRALARVLVAVTAQQLVPRADGKGRILASGVLIPDERARRAIAEGEIGELGGAPTLRADLAGLVEQGLVTARAVDGLPLWPVPAAAGGPRGS
jgi:twitching motility protein PilT